MPRSTVEKSLSGSGVRVSVRRHDWIRANIGSKRLGVVLVVVIVRTIPNAGGVQCDHSVDCHQQTCQRRVVKDSAVLVIVVDDEHPYADESRQEARQNSDAYV